MKYVPEDIWAGHLALRKHTPEAKVIKAYVKFAQTWRELEAALPQCTSLPADTIAATPNSKRSGNIARSCTALAALPLALTQAPAPQVVSKPVAMPKAKFFNHLQYQSSSERKSAWLPICTLGPRDWSGFVVARADHPGGRDCNSNHHCLGHSSHPEVPQLSRRRIQPFGDAACAHRRGES